MKTLRIGDSSDDVKLLQRYLTELNYNIGKIDGIFETGTQSAVKQFQSKNKLTADGIVETTTWTTINNTIKKLSEIQVLFASDLSDYRKNIVSIKSIIMIKNAALESKNSKVTITSTIRTPQEQANAMYNNESNNNHIAYADPGRQVIKVYNDNKTKDKETVINLMVEKIEELAKTEKLVSSHCVTEEMYKKENIFDISYKNLPNPKDFTNALLKNKSISKIITPLGDKSINYNNDVRISIDTKEPAIHIQNKIN